MKLYRFIGTRGWQLECTYTPAQCILLPPRQWSFSPPPARSMHNRNVHRRRANSPHTANTFRGCSMLGSGFSSDVIQSHPRAISKCKISDDDMLSRLWSNGRTSQTASGRPSRSFAPEVKSYSSTRSNPAFITGMNAIWRAGCSDIYGTNERPVEPLPISWQLYLKTPSSKQ